MRLALRLIVECAVGLDEAEGQTDLQGQAGQRLELFEDQPLDLSGGDVVLATAESLAVGEAGVVGADARAPSPRRRVARIAARLPAWAPQETLAEATRASRAASLG